MGFGCTSSEAGGLYSVKGLPSGEYLVEFWPEEAGDYAWAYYGGESPTRVPVTVGDQTEDIDIALQEAAEITGRVTDATSGAGVREVLVCLHDPVSGEYERCTYSYGGGVYSITGVGPGSYKVGFSEEPEAEFADGYDTQFYPGQTSLASAATITATAGQPLSGIDAVLTRTGSGHGSPPIATPLPILTKKPPIHRRLSCKKGFKKKRVHGKTRCVKKKKKHHKKRK